jgi:CubicO group peptidase (beta-lactamase class C family)
MRGAGRIGAFVLVAGFSFAPGALGQWPRPSVDLGSYTATLDSVIPALLALHAVPGAAVLLIEHGRPAAIRTYGYADWQRTKPIEPTTVFGVASLSKLVTAWGLMRLVASGRMELDAPAGRYLSAAHRRLLSFNPDTVTIRQLVSHTAGLSQRSVGEYWLPDSVPSLESEISGRTESGDLVLRLLAPPGSEWRYSGGGFALLQLAMEDVSGSRFGELLSREVFAPLGMTHSVFGNPESTNPAMAYHVDETGSGVLRAGYANLAAAALYTTIADFGLLAAYDMSRGRAGPSVLDEKALVAMETPVPGSKGGYGLGYFIESTPGGPLVGHDGSDIGWNSMYRGLPDRGDAFVMFTSGSNGIAVYGAPLCGWLRWKTGVARRDYCQASSNTLMTTLFRAGETAATSELAARRQQDPAFDIPERYWNFLAGSMLQRHQTASALSLLRLIATAHPKSADAFYHLGAGYLAAQDGAAAMANFRRALELDPTHELAKRALKR